MREPLKIRSIPQEHLPAAASVGCDVCPDRRAPVWLVDVPADSKIGAAVGTIAVMCDSCLLEATAEVLELSEC